MNNVNTRSLPFSEYLRQRRMELHLKQAEVAAHLHVSLECVSHWEAGRRRMELNKIPRTAELLKIPAADLCRKALDEWFPAFHDALFAAERRPPMPCLEAAHSGQSLLASAAPDRGALEPGVIVGDRLGEAEQLPQ